MNAFLKATVHLISRREPLHVGNSMGARGRMRWVAVKVEHELKRTVTERYAFVDFSVV